MRDPNGLSEKGRYQQGFAVIYFVIAVFFAVVVFDDYNLFIVAGATMLLYLLGRFIIGFYVDKKQK
ncbi:hypothetical protein [Halobacillus campisalis]|uniref:Uncharacterized protein n=1 Tax=Halobacillus campisalis TaxID=435909 RepID=A0ABW2JZY9_9BACI|nr:hypothetical protein [Halobacillus campisalis]